MKNVLIFGSGMVISPYIEYLLPKNKITCASFEQDLMNNLKQKYPEIACEKIDVTKDNEKMKELMKKCDIVASFVPPTLHPYVAKICLEIGKNLVTTSYISDYMLSINDKVKEKGLIFMNEIGLDPGIDHLIAHKVIDEEHSLGNKILEFKSYCGALVTPSCCDNPFKYKFSWSVKGVLLATNNSSTQLIKGKESFIDSKENLINTVNTEFFSGLDLEGYYNRNSLPYKESYGLKDAHTIIRGTIRYKNSTFAFQCLKNLGLFEDVKHDSKTWIELLNKLHPKSLIRNFNISLNAYNENSDSNELSEDDQMFYFNLTLVAISKFSLNYVKTNGGYESLYEKAFRVFTYLDFHDKNNKVRYFFIFKLLGVNIIDELSNLLGRKLKMEKNDVDLNLMHNEFLILTKEGRYKKRILKLLTYGTSKHSATALTVGTPSAIATQMILDNEIHSKGVIIPKDKNVCDKILSELGKMNIKVTETKSSLIKF